MADALVRTEECAVRAGALTGLFPGTQAQASAGALELREMPVPGQISLRGNPDDAAFVKGVSTVLGCELPREPNTVNEAGDVSVLWLGPDEWLIVCGAGAEGEMTARLAEVLSDLHCAITDVTGNRAQFRLSGPLAREVLAKGCSLDLHPSKFGPGCCAQTLVVRAGVILVQSDDQPTYMLMPRRSFAEYLWLWLDDAMGEYR